MTGVSDLPRLPFERPSVLDISPLYRQFQLDGSLRRVVTPAGDTAWLATRYDHVRALYVHPALGRSHPEPDRAAKFLAATQLGGPIGDSQTEQAEHSRMRATLSKSFSARRMEDIRPGVEAIVDELLSALEEQGPPADLQEGFCFPLPARVICELLGVPFADQENFRAWADGALHMHDPSHARESLERLDSYMGALIDEKRLRPGDDMISDVVAAAGGGRLFERQVTQLVVALFLGGHETTVARLGFGALFLLTLDGQRRALQENPALIAQVVEEVLRMAVPGLGLIPRYATADIDIDGTTIAAGDLVLLGNGAANRDPSMFVDPDRFDATRASNQHVAFGYGPRFCLGAGLARVELNCALGRLFARFTSLRLAVPIEDLRLRDDVFTGGLVSLPVEW